MPIYLINKYFHLQINLPVYRYLRYSTDVEVAGFY